MGISPNELAERLNRSPKDVRAQLRKLTDVRAGRGGSWDLDEDACDAIAAAFEGRKDGRKAVRPILRMRPETD